MIKYLENEKLEDLTKEGIVLVDFYADWCGPCKMLGRLLEDLDLNIVKINTDTHVDLAQKFGVMSIPTVLIYKDGEVIDKFIGFRSKQEINDLINKL